MIFELHINPKKYILNYLNPEKFNLDQVITIYIWRYWVGLLGYLWTGLNYSNWLISDFIDRRKITITGRDFVTNYIPAASVATFKLQNDADLIAIDSVDNLWFDGGGNQSVVTAANLYGTDYSCTLVKCNHSAPYDIHSIGVGDTSSFTVAQINKAHEDFELWMFWNGILNAFGYIKANRTIP
jgi:hypothetical protein